MRRREFLCAIGGITAWPLVAKGQQQGRPVVGFLGSRARDDDPQLLAAFRKGLEELGYREGQNLAIEYRFAANQYARLPALAAELVAQKVDVMFANGPAAQAAKAATTTIPIVFTAGFDPVKVGLVASLNRPGGNITGVSILDVDLGPKRIELFRELIPGARRIGALVNRTDAARSKIMEGGFETAARALGLEVQILHASSDQDLDDIFGKLKQTQSDGLVIGGEPFLNSRSGKLGALTISHRVPTIFQFRAFAAAGGLASYGSSLVDAYRVAGSFAGRILKGDKPADMPVQLATKFELIINLKTAKLLGISVSLPLAGRADELIE